MRIGMMADMYYPHVSGVTIHTSLIKRALEQSGHKVHVFTFGNVDYKDEEPNVIRSPGLPLAGTGYHLSFRHITAARRMLQTMDVVHTHHPFVSGFLALRYCQPFGIPVVFTNHTRYDLYAQAYLPVVADQIGMTLLETYMPAFCRAVDLVIAPSDGVKQVMRDIGIDARIEVVPNGVDLEPFRRVTQPVPREQLGVGKSDLLLVYSGRLGPEKNLGFLLRAFAGVQAAFPNTMLLLLGDGPERESLEDLVARSRLQKRVVFTGMVPYNELPRYLAAADAFVTASVSEVHPLSVIEALATGLPVVGVQSPGVGDIVIDEINGLLSAEDLPAFTAKLSRFLADGSLRQRLAKQAAASAAKFDVRRTAALLEQHYSQLAAEPRKRKVTRWDNVLLRLLDEL